MNEVQQLYKTTFETLKEIDTSSLSGLQKAREYTIAMSYLINKAAIKMAEEESQNLHRMALMGKWWLNYDF